MYVLPFALLVACAPDGRLEGKPAVEDTGSPDSGPGGDTGAGDDTAGSGDTGGFAGGDGPWSDVSMETADAVLAPESGSIAHVVAAADLDGDGLDEALVGVGDVRGVGTREGAVYAFAGGTVVGERSDIHATWTLFGEQPGDYAGYAITAADLDGDGALDLVTSARQDWLGDVSQRGAVLVEHAPAPGEGSIYASGTRIEGAEDGALLGDGIGAGDVDGDGVAELFVTAPRASGIDGRAWLFRDPRGVLDVEDAAVRFMDGRDETLFSGGSAVGDLDGDGLADVLLGAPYADALSTDVGAVYLFRAPFDATVRQGDEAARFEGAVEGSWAGATLAIGDLDGDGAAEAVMTAAGSPDQTVYAFDGRTSGDRTLPDAKISFRTEERTSNVGSAFAIADYDGDRELDLAIGASRAGEAHEGVVFVLCGPLAGAYGPPDADAELWSKTPEGAAGDHLAAGDLDGDGIADLLIGGKPAAWVFYGGSRAGLPPGPR